MIRVSSFVTVVALLDPPDKGLHYVDDPRVLNTKELAEAARAEIACAMADSLRARGDRISVIESV